MIRFRKMELADISAAIWLCRSAHWNQTPQDWELLIKLGKEGCRVAESGNKIIGSVSTVSYADVFSWIGMVLVDPEHRRQGLGTALLNEAISILGDQQTVGLDATPAGREVYLKLNFHDEYAISRLTGLIKLQQQKNIHIRHVTDSDIKSICSFDEKVFGAPRDVLLKWHYQHRPDLSLVYTVDENIQGYCFGRSGFRFTQIGPVIATSRAIAGALTLEAIGHCRNSPVVVDATHFDQEWMDWLLSLGFAEQRAFARMYRGRPVTAGLSLQQYAIAGPEFG